MLFFSPESYQRDSQNDSLCTAPYNNNNMPYCTPQTYKINK